jgi:hypothetical protein
MQWMETFAWRDNSAWLHENVSRYSASVINNPPHYFKRHQYSNNHR